MFNFGYLLSGHTIFILCEQVYEDVWLFFEAKRDPQTKKFGKHCHMLIIFTVVCQAVVKAWCGKGMFLC